MPFFIFYLFFYLYSFTEIMYFIGREGKIGVSLENGSGSTFIILRYYNTSKIFLPMRTILAPSSIAI
jgi:hypothetical protein